VLERQLDYWREQLADLPVLEIPTDHTRPAVQSYSGRRATFTIPAATTQQLKDLSQQEGATLFMVLLAAFQLLLSRYSEQEDIVIGTAVAGRNRAETEGLIGCFVNTLVMRTDLTGGPTFKELMKRVREVCLGAYAHQEVPFEKLVEELQPERDPSRSPLVQVAFGLENTPKGEMTAVSALQINSFDSEVEVVRLDLTLWVMDGNDELSLSWTYNTDLFESATIARMQRHFETLLQSVVEQPEAQIHDLSYISQAEREEQLLRKQERIAANRQQLQRIKRKGFTLTKDRVNPELIGALTLQTVTQSEMDHEH
ncbi:MAG TPA: condensation domain-containing protein, partial [Pyrinomonadaceae bacterium]|nr:condensation domain-containing protein [Pyrinomonadaceae bacterium]